MNTGVKFIEGEYLENSIDPDLESDFSAFRDELTQGEDAEGTITAYKVPTDDKGNPVAKTRKQSYLFATPAGSVTLIDIIARIKREFIRPNEHFMVVRLIGSRKGARGNPFNKIIYIEKENEAPAAAPPPGSGPDVVALMRAMQESVRDSAQRSEAFMQKLMDMQLQLATARAAPAASGAGDPMVMMEKMMLMQAMFQKFMPMLGVAAATAATATDPVAQLMSTMRVMKEMKSFLGDGEPVEGSDNLIGALKSLAGPAFTFMAENEKTKRALIARGPAPRKPAPVGAASSITPATPTASPAPSTSTPAGDPMLSAFRDQLKTLCDMASEGTSPKDAADVVLQHLPEEYDDALGNLVDDAHRAQFQLQIGTLYAGCREHAAWFEELRQNLALAFDNPDAEPNA